MPSSGEWRVPLLRLLDVETRSTRPKTLLRIAPRLFIKAIQARTLGIIDGDVLMNGVSYFTGPLLNWSLARVIQTLLLFIQRTR